MTTTIESEFCEQENEKNVWEEVEGFVLCVRILCVESIKTFIVLQRCQIQTSSNA